jgi:tryptophan synthase alpha chain
VSGGRQRIQQVLEGARAEGRAALLVCLPSNQPTAWLVAAAKACTAAGADLLEFQVYQPHHPAEVVKAIAVVAQEVPPPCLLWTDFPVVHDFALTEAQPWRLVPECLRAGIAGVAAPVGSRYTAAFAAACGDDLARIPFVSPDMRPDDLEGVCGHGPAFVYAIGVNTSPPTDADVFEEVAEYLERVRQIAGAPVFLGAGVGTPAQAALAATFADGVAVAKAVFQTLGRASAEGRDELAALAWLVRELRQASVRGHG